MGVAISENFADLLEPGLRKIYTGKYNQLPEMRPLIFNVQPASTSYEKDSSVGGFSDMPVFKGTISYDNPKQGYDVTYTHCQFAKGFQIERALLDDDLYNVIAKEPKKLAIAASRTMEKQAASMFNDGFSGSGTIVIDGVTVLNNTEGKSLFNTAHPNTRTSTTQGNSGTTALSATSVEATRRLMCKFLDDTDNYISVVPDTIMVPRDLEDKAWTIIASKGKVDSAENNANFLFGKYKLAVWQFLTDSNNWFMFDSVLAEESFNWYDRVGLEFFQDKSFSTLIARYANYARWSYGYSDWKSIYGHNVAS